MAGKPGKKERREEWILIGGFRVEPTLLKRFKAALAEYNYSSMTDAFRDFMRQMVDKKSFIKEEIKVLKARVLEVEKHLGIEGRD